LRTRFPTLAILAFLALTLGLLFVAPTVLRLAFPALATLTAIALFRSSRTAYIQFCFWLWFLSPLLRRLVDFRTEFVATSPLLLAPFFAASVSGVVLFHHIRSLAQRQNSGAIPFACAFAAIAFGTIFGLARYAPVEVARGLINWIAPALFGFFLYQESLRKPTRYIAYRAAVTSSLLWGTLLLSLYGIAQFFLLLPWDEAWMIGLKDYAFGQPRPLELRVFSTMNAPATFASYAMAGLLVAFAVLTQNDNPRARLLAAITAPAGLLALALTTSRSLWVGLACGVLYLAATLPSRARVRVVSTVLVTLALAGIATEAPGIHEVVLTRIQSFSSGGSDISANARVNGHLDALAKLTTEPLGEGMGSIDTDHATDGSDDRLGPHDSTLLELLFALGAPGTLIYSIGLGAALVAIFFPRTRTPQQQDPLVYALRAIVFAFFAQCLLTSILVGVPGFLVWTCLALALAANDLAPELSPRRQPDSKLNYLKLKTHEPGVQS
jgi:hypothetical protein